MRAPLNSSPISPRRRTSALVGVLAVAALLLAGCGSDDGDDETIGGDDTASTETTEAPSSTTEAETTETTEGPSSETTASTPTDDGDDGEGDGGATTEPADGALAPGDVCSLEEGDPDCIDPDGDGEGVYLIGGADCAANAPDISVCEDLDGDGNAGYPDEYSDLPTCSADVPPPCNNPPGSSNDE